MAHRAGVDSTDKFDQHTVTGTLYDSAPILRNCRVKKLPSVSVQPRQRTFLRNPCAPMSALRGKADRGKNPDDSGAYPKLPALLQQVGNCSPKKGEAWRIEVSIRDDSDVRYWGKVDIRRRRFDVRC